MGVAGGATKAAFTQHQARRDNMADVSAKDGSQVGFFNYKPIIQIINFFRIKTIKLSQRLLLSSFVIFGAGSCYWTVQLSGKVARLARIKKSK